MSLVVAIFLVVVIASLSAFAVTTGTATRQSTNLQLQADRALAAARAGAEWGAYRTLVQSACPGATNVPMNAGAIRGFQVTVTCLANTNHGTYRVADIQSVARWGVFGSPDYAYRSITVRYSNGGP